MDLLAQIIERKKTDTNDILPVVKNLLQDIISYEKLATNKKFQQLDNKVVAKRCPTLVKMLDTSTLEYVIMKDLLPLLVDFTGRSIGTLTLLEQTKKEEILNKTYGFTLNISDLSTLSKEPKEYIVLKETINETDYKILLFVPNGKRLRIYNKTINENILDAKTVEPLYVTSDNNAITLISYSRLGNNDYIFGYINNKPIRIRGQFLLVGECESYFVNINELAMMKNEKDVANYLLNIYRGGE